MNPNYVLTSETGGFVYKAGDQFVNISVENVDGIVKLHVTHHESPKKELKGLIREILKELKEE
tara:strand:- start:7269 stop:7457 length:189 start_codon:yes stop_codon:yes gene_type:complete